MFALPREMRQRGVRRYGFHGLSYDYIASVMGEHDARLCEGRVIVAHLGNGASLCAMQAGVSVATTKGSPPEGLPMGTRCGAVDPGVIAMLREMRLTPRRPSGPYSPKSGLLGVSGLSNDMRLLRARIDERGRATCHRPIRLPDHARDRLLVSALGGLDALIFTAGIGENDVATRAEVVEASNGAARP